MNPSHPNLHSTRLENLGIEPYGARFDLDGRTVQIRGDSRTPLVGALQAFHRAALDDYHAREPAPQPGFFSRLRSWFGRILGARPAEQAPGAALSGPAASVPTAPARQPSETAPRVPASAAEARPAARGAADPVLRAVYADKDGVHLVWQPAAGGSRAKPIALTSSLDSQLAQRLEDCYGHLAELGYKVAGLELVRPERKAEAKERSEPAAGRPPAEKPAEAAPRPRVPRARPAPAKEPRPLPQPEPGM
jgi:hypothetical protein